MFKKQKAATAILLAMSLAQPTPLLAQSEQAIDAIRTSDAFADVLACLANAGGNPKDAERACLEETKLAQLPCNSNFLGLSKQSDEKGGSAEKVAIRIVRNLNIEACIAEDAVSVGVQAQVIRTAETAASEAKAAAKSAVCVDELVDDSGATLCSDGMTQAEISAFTTTTIEDADVDITIETVSESDTRSSQQEFVETSTDSDGGLTSLEKAGLLALGAVVVGTILQNGERVTAKTGDRIVVQDQFGNYSILKDDNALVREVGSTVRTETYDDGSTRSYFTRADGVQIVTIRDPFGQVQQRIRIETDGTQIILIDDLRTFEPVVLDTLPSWQSENLAYRDAADITNLRAALQAADTHDFGRSFSLSQVRQHHEVRNTVPEINLDNITFRTESASIEPSQAIRLRGIALLMVDYIEHNPRELFLIEGYTDAVGDESYNLLLSDRRAETVALALSEYFGVRPENMVIQGYGESFPLIPTLAAERLNRRVAVRRITTLIEPR